MTEQSEPEQMGDPAEPNSPAEPGHSENLEGLATGHPAVDEVLRSLSRLGSTPVEEHPEIFGSAHEQLRDILAGAGKEQDSAPVED